MAEPLVVIHVASGDLWAGAEVQLYQLVTALSRDNAAKVTASVVLLNEGLLAQRLRDRGIDVTVLPESEMSSRQILLALMRHFRSRRPDVVHTHRQKENVLGSLAARMAGVPRSLRTVHGAPEFGPGGLAQRINRWLDRMSGRFLQDAIVLVTDDLRQKMADSYPAKKCHVIENGIEPPLPDNRVAESRYRRENQINVCFAGRLSEVKRPDIFIATATALARASDQRFHFHVFGDGPWLADVTAQIERDNVTDTVSLWGFNDDMPGALLEMDVLIMTSNHEGLPMIMLEAMSLGVPIIAHAVGGMPEVLDNGGCGVLVTRHDGNGFADALTGAVDADSLVRLADAAKRRFESHYTIAHCADRYAELYQGRL